MSESKINLLFRMKIIILEMMVLRGYDISNEVEVLGFNLEQFINKYTPKNPNKSMRSLLTSVYVNNKTQQRLCVYFADINNDTTTFGKEYFVSFLLYLDTEAKTNNGIIITEKALSSNVKKSITQLPAYNIQVYLDTELSCNPTKHYLVPKQEIMSEEEVSIFLSNNKKIKLEQLPVILPSDPIVKFLGGKLGQVMRIHRYSMLNSMNILQLFYKLISHGLKRNIEGDDENTVDEIEETDVLSGDLI